VPKKRSPGGKMMANYFSRVEFVTEDEFITPSILPLYGTESRFVYYAFNQHFNPFEIRKYEIQMEVLDLSIQKALELKDEAVRVVSDLDLRFVGPEKETFEDREILVLTNLCNRLQGITGRHKIIYDMANMSNYLFTNRTYSSIRDAIFNDISYIDQAINTKTRDYGIGRNSTAVSKWSDRIRYIKNEFGLAVKPLIEQNLSSNLNIVNGLVSNPLDYVSYTSILEMPSTVINNLPTIENKFEKSYRYKDVSTLEQRAPNLNLDFACLDINVGKNPNDASSANLTCIESQDNADIYVLVGHAHNSVSSPRFALLSEIRSDLLNNSIYLCKTHHIEGENQYFLLGT
jgi:hypothetical protein